MENIASYPPSTLKARLAALQQAIRVAGGASAHTPRLIGVSKTHPAEAITEAITLGLSDFGENKVQEAAAKYPALKAAHPHIRLHLIGPLQSNKAADAVTLFDVIHTIDRPKIADAILAEIKKQTANGTLCSPKDEPEQSGERRSQPVAEGSPLLPKAPPRCLIQVNIGEEAQKAGVTPQELAGLLAHCRRIGLPIDGLMCIPPANENPAPYFALMQKLKHTHGLAELSMGMSGDFETAIRLGATIIRVGTALFGERPSTA